MAPARYLKGDPQEGMFSREVAFVVKDSQGRQHVVLVPRTMVHVRQGVSTIQVRVVDEGEDIAVVRMPGESLDSNTVAVKTSELVA